MDDRVPQPRGLGLKVFNVEGAKINGNGNTQDFEFNSCNILELGSAQTAFEIIGLRESSLRCLFILLRRLDELIVSESQESSTAIQLHSQTPSTSDLTVQSSN